MARESDNPRILAQYGICRPCRSYRARNFRLPIFVQLVEMPEDRGNFCAVFVRPPRLPRASWLRRFWSGQFWSASDDDEDEWLLVAVISTRDDSHVSDYPAVCDWLRAHCGWNF